jgi:AcrR family transcriptional regulator
MPGVDKRKPTYGNADAPGKGPRARTYRLLLAEAMELVRSGRVPSVAEVAVRSGVSRATAYRYFESRSKLISAVIGEGLAPVRTTETAAVSGPQRLRELFEKTFPLFKKNERHMRAALMLAPSTRGRAPAAEEESRRGHRPTSCGARRRCWRRFRALFDRLLKALSLSTASRSTSC